jgi:hypothetical protein
MLGDEAQVPPFSRTDSDTQSSCDSFPSRAFGWRRARLQHSAAALKLVDLNDRIDVVDPG